MGWIIFAAIYFVGAGCATLWCRLQNLATPAPYDQRPVWLFALLWWVLVLHWIGEQMERRHFNHQLHRRRA